MGHEKKWNDRQAKTVLGVKQILFISTTENKKKTVWRICILILGLKRFKKIRELTVMHVLLWTPWAFFQIHVLFWPFQSVLEEKTLLIQTLWWSAKRLENCLELLMQTHHPAKKSNKNAANNFFVHVWSSWPETLHDVSNANFPKMNNFLYANWLRAMVDGAYNLWQVPNPCCRPLLVKKLSFVLYFKGFSLSLWLSLAGNLPCTQQCNSMNL